MASCKECLHHDFCNVDGYIDAEDCKVFKNKADFVEVKHGHWIWLEGNLYECSECPSKTEVDECMNEPLYEYCPYCGAKMEGLRKDDV